MPIPEITQTDNAQLRDIADTIAASKRIVVISGAGISTSCGIPVSLLLKSPGSSKGIVLKPLLPLQDFRSPDGLYNLLHSSSRASNSTSSPTTVKGKDLFSSQLWNSPPTTAAFYKFIASLRDSIHNDVKSVSSTHRFLRTLREGKKLVRVYTQNIDDLETRAGLVSDLSKGKGSRSRFSRKAVVDAPSKSLPSPTESSPGCEVVPLHGTLTHLRCTQCLAIIPWESTSSSLFHQGLAPPCPLCSTTSSIRSALGKRSCSTKVGSLRPNIVLYGEEHTPAQADSIGEITQWDLGSKPDLLLILGTSLHVHGLKVLVREFAKAVRAKWESNGNMRSSRPKVVYVNLGRPSESVWSGIIDTWVNIACDEWVAVMRRMRPDIWETQTRLYGRVSKPIQSGLSLKCATKAACKAVIADSYEEEDEDLEGDKENSPLRSSLMSMLQKQQPATPRKGRQTLALPSPLSTIAKPRKRPLSELQDNTLPVTPSKRLRPHQLLPTPPSTSSNKRRWSYPENMDLIAESDDILPLTSTKIPQYEQLPASTTHGRPIEVEVFQDRRYEVPWKSEGFISKRIFPFDFAWMVR